MGAMGKDMEFAGDPVSIQSQGIADRVRRGDVVIVPGGEDIGRGVVFPDVLFEGQFMRKG